MAHSIFIDASALVAILTDESDASALQTRMLQSGERFTAAHAIFETGAALARKASLAQGRPIEADDLAYAGDLVSRFCEAAAITVVDTPAKVGAEALASAGRFGKLTGHPAQLNMGDCLTYAMAKTLGLALLFKGDDFGYTDLRLA